jgi:hypothetical protein
MSKRGEKFIVEGLNYWYSVPKKYQLKGEQMTHQLTGKSVLVNCEAWNNTWPGPISVIMKHPRVAKSNLTEEMLSSL